MAQVLPAATIGHATTLLEEAAPHKSALVTLFGNTLQIMEGGNYSIDIVRSPVPEKWNAMQDYLSTVLKDVKAQEGVYFGNQNQYPDDRDGCMQKIAGLKVLAVDQKQESVTSGVTAIGRGPEATLKQLQEYGALSPDKRPRFLGFDVDDTVLGLRSDKSKEELLKDRRPLAEMMVTLALSGTQLAFFSDNDSQVTLKRIGYPLVQLFEEMRNSKPIEITFYVSKMLIKLKLVLGPNKKLSIEYDKTYGTHSRLSARDIVALKQAVGKVEEAQEGTITATGVLGDYYTESLTKKQDTGRYTRKEQFYPEFVTKETPAGNVLWPEATFRDQNLETGDASMLALAPFPPQHRATIIQALAVRLL